MLKITGFDKLQKEIDKLSRNLAAFNGEHKIPVNDLLTPSFLMAHTTKSSAQQLFEDSGFSIDNQDDLEAISESDLDTYIRSISNFSGWKNMLARAAEIWAKNKLGF